MIKGHVGSIRPTSAHRPESSAGGTPYDDARSYKFRAIKQQRQKMVAIRSVPDFFQVKRALDSKIVLSVNKKAVFLAGARKTQFVIIKQNTAISICHPQP
jgi:hypothetical protein